MCKFNSILTFILITTFNYCTPFFFRLPDKHKTVEIIKWTIQKTSTISILGATNVNNFECGIKGYYQPDTIYCYEPNNINKMVTLKGDLRLNIFAFDCNKKMLTNDLRKTLKAVEYPTMIIRFLSLERSPVINNNKDFLKGLVEIELAGICRRFEINYSFLKTNTSCIQLNGGRTFTFADFKLIPPQKFAGLIKVKDLFAVNFQLILEPVK